MTSPPIQPIPPQPAASPLTAEHLRQLAAAHASLKKIRTAVVVAKIDGWTIGAFGGISLLLGCTSVAGWIVGAGLIAVAVVELRAAKRLGRLDASAPRTLAINQFCLGGLLILYALWRIYLEYTGQGILETIKTVDPHTAKQLADVEHLVRLIAVAIYGVLIGVAVFCQGGLAVYYLARGRLLRDYLARTPQWVISMQRTAAMA